MKKTTIFFLLFLLLGSALAQVSFRNQFVYTNWKEYDRQILEDWADLNYQLKAFKFGLRYEINHPPDPFIFDKTDLVDEYAFTYRYMQYRWKKMNFTLGNYYEMFGRGLTLRTYEDRNLRVDNNLDGFKFGYKGRKLRTKIIVGKMRDKYNRRKDMLYGLDGEIKPLKGLHLGGSYLRQENDKKEAGSMWASRVNYSRSWWDFYGELARPDWTDKYSYYTAVNLAFEKISITMEYKDYDHLSFSNSYDSEYNAAPSLSREHSFSLLNRHPHALNLNNEKGYQIEAAITPWEMWEVIVNHSKTSSHENQILFSEWYAQAHLDYHQNFEIYGAIAWSEDISTENITPLVDGSFNLSDRDQLHISYQHQHTTNKINLSEFDNEFILMEFSRSPGFSAALVGEWTNEDQLPNWQKDKNYWLYGTLSFNFWENQRVSILYGSRKEGFVCVGGVCRYEPEFNGLEIKINNRF